MHCIKCHSPRVIRFIDGFGQPRLFCRSCQESFSLKEITQNHLFEQTLQTQKRLLDFTDYYSNLVRL